MAGEKRFRSSLFGYKKQDVYEFIEKLAKDLEEQIKSKDDELANLRTQNQEFKKQVEELSGKLNTIESGRTYIADAIIKAEEQAKSIIDHAVKEAENRKAELQMEIDEYRHALENVKQEIRGLRLEAINRIKKYENDLLDIAGIEEEYLDEAAPSQAESISSEE
ncbi:DivIVA domain-containing protein [Petroclostridium sp. X23]|jgi:cell division initiation protein|uniref:DivIVA domain-containing protein n=1 Tax=Petroclostridium sp. X23 TaxID=3045146 RepID=UPI0024ACC94D|nr:DivIVA domain-containing protein [Petroclostridium sp. X23]WHH60727.1 DivIVA domain-containing protein [Petroclostridium sp. X23]